jgi:hypothetical protein
VDDTLQFFMFENMLPGQPAKIAEYSSISWLETIQKARIHEPAFFEF